MESALTVFIIMRNMIKKKTRPTHPRASSSNDLRVIPGRIRPLSGGVINSCSKQLKEHYYGYNIDPYLNIIVDIKTRLLWMTYIRW